jgi:peptidoglycan LD-endopeptidase CwlK
MPLSKRSLTNLAGCHPLLTDLLTAVNEIVPCEVVCGWRNEADQNAAFAAGTSDRQWPNGRHNNTLPDGMPYSMAADVCPLPINWDNTNAFYFFAGIVIAQAKEIGINIIWGGNWANDNLIVHQKGLNDLDHFEIKGE